MSSLYFDVMLSNAKVATVAIRQLQIEHWVYEVQIPGEPTHRGTVEWLGRNVGTGDRFTVGDHMLSLIAAVLTDYTEAVAASQRQAGDSSSAPVPNPLRKAPR